MSELKEHDRTFHIVGHRGYPEKYPENTLLGLRQAANLGIEGLELDVQCTQDGELIVLHDKTYTRTCNIDTHAHHVMLDQALSFSAHEPNRFGNRFLPEPITKLETLIAELSFYQGLFFIEIKREAVDFLGIEKTTEKLIEATAGIHQKRVFISFHEGFSEYVKSHTAIPVGWVIKHYNEQSIAFATRIQPNYLICNKTKLPQAALPTGNWEWFIYDVVDKNEAQELNNRGIKYIESWDPAALL